MFLLHDLYKEFAWWFWLMTVPCLVAHLFGLSDTAIFVAMTLTAVQFVYYLNRDRHLLSFPVQVRMAYLALLVQGLIPPFDFIHWIQLLGTSAFVLVGYCPLARMLSLLPLNRNEPLTWGYVARALFTPPVSGSILRRMPEKAA